MRPVASGSVVPVNPNSGRVVFLDFQTLSSITHVCGQ